MWNSDLEDVSVQLGSLFDELLPTYYAGLAELFTEGTEYLKAEASHPASSALSLHHEVPCITFSFPFIEGMKSIWFCDWWKRYPTVGRSSVLEPKVQISMEPPIHEPLLEHCLPSTVMISL